MAESDVLLTIKHAEMDDILPINIRPFFKECLKLIKNHYQVIIFTAAQKPYADTILNYLDPHNELIEYRVYRDHCIVSKDGLYIKDLRIFEDQWDMKDIILIDNAAHSFALQVCNGIPMLPFYDNKNDKELVYLTHFLDTLSLESDIRPILKNTFWLELLHNPLI